MDSSASMIENNEGSSLKQDFEEDIPVVGDELKGEGMEVAMKLAQQALRVGEVPVGCVFVHEEKIIAIGRNTVNETRNATRHAEINCIDDVCVFEICRKLLDGYTSVFCLFVFTKCLFQLLGTEVVQK